MFRLRISAAFQPAFGRHAKASSRVPHPQFNERYRSDTSAALWLVQHYLFAAVPAFEVDGVVAAGAAADVCAGAAIRTERNRHPVDFPPFRRPWPWGKQRIAETLPESSHITVELYNTKSLRCRQWHIAQLGLTNVDRWAVSCRSRSRLKEPAPYTMQLSLNAKGFVVAAACLVTLAGRPARAGQQDHRSSSTDVQAGLKLYTSECSLCHGPNGDLMSGIDLRRGRFRRAVSDDDLARVITNGVPDAGMPGFKLQAGEVTSLIAFIRAGFDVSGAAVKIGDPSRGQALFAGKAACATCHRVNGVGPRTAPDLSDIGASRTAATLQRSLLDPIERDVADQSAGSHHDPRRQDLPRPSSQ